MQREIKFVICRNQVYVSRKSRLRFKESSLSFGEIKIAFKESSLSVGEIKFTFQRIKFAFCRNQDCVFLKSSQFSFSRNQVYVSKNQVLFHRIEIAFQRIKFMCKESSCCNIVNELRRTRYTLSPPSITIYLMLENMNISTSWHSFFFNSQLESETNSESYYYNNFITIAYL